MQNSVEAQAVKVEDESANETNLAKEQNNMTTLWKKYKAWRKETQMANLVHKWHLQPM